VVGDFRARRRFCRQYSLLQIWHNFSAQFFDCGFFFSPESNGLGGTAMARCILRSGGSSRNRGLPGNFELLMNYMENV
jgi:hypothetical protein